MPGLVLDQETKYTMSARNFSGRFGGRLALVYGGIFLAIGAYLPFFPVWMKARGLTATEIAIVFAIPVFAKVLMSPLVAAIADRTGKRRLILSLLAFGATLAGINLNFISSFYAVLLGVFILSLFWNPILPITEALAVTGARARGLDYGRMRLWGSLSFIVANLVGGWLLDQVGADASLYLIIGAFIFTFLMTLGLPPPGNVATPGRITLADQKSSIDRYMLRNPAFLGFLGIAALLQSSHAVYYLFSTLHWSATGLSSTVIGALWATGVAAEILLFVWSGQALRSFGTGGLMLIAAIAGIVRWTALGFDLSVFWLFPVQLLHAFTFAATHLAVINYIADKAPERLSGTAQSLNFAITGIAMSLATLAAGPLFLALSGKAYLVMAALAGIAVVFLAMFKIATGKA